MKKNYINVVVKAPGEAAKITQIENTLEAFQKIVGGYIETFTIATDCTIVCNEEGAAYRSTLQLQNVRRRFLRNGNALRRKGRGFLRYRSYQPSAQALVPFVVHRR